MKSNFYKHKKKILVLRMRILIIPSLMSLILIMFGCNIIILTLMSLLILNGMAVLQTSRNNVEIKKVYIRALVLSSLIQSIIINTQMKIKTAFVFTIFIVCFQLSEGKPIWFRPTPIDNYEVDCDG